MYENKKNLILFIIINKIFILKNLENIHNEKHLGNILNEKDLSNYNHDQSLNPLENPKDIVKPEKNNESKNSYKIYLLLGSLSALIILIILGLIYCRNNNLLCWKNSQLHQSSSNLVSHNRSSHNLRNNQSLIRQPMTTNPPQTTEIPISNQILEKKPITGEKNNVQNNLEIIQKDKETQESIKKFNEIYDKIRRNNDLSVISVNKQFFIKAESNKLSIYDNSMTKSLINISLDSIWVNQTDVEPRNELFNIINFNNIEKNIILPYGYSQLSDLIINLNPTTITIFEKFIDFINNEISKYETKKTLIEEQQKRINLIIQEKNEIILNELNIKITKQDNKSFALFNNQENKQFFCKIEENKMFIDFNQRNVFCETFSIKYRDDNMFGILDNSIDIKLPNNIYYKSLDLNAKNIDFFERVFNTIEEEIKIEEIKN